VNIPDLELGRLKILRSCNIRRHQLISLAFTPNGRVICLETNRAGSGDVSNFSWHSEEFLIKKLTKIKARERFGKIYVLVARLSRVRPGTWTLAKPCDGCGKKLLRYVDKVFYTDEEGETQLYYGG
jgi:hypothetical protein